MWPSHCGWSLNVLFAAKFVAKIVTSAVDFREQWKINAINGLIGYCKKFRGKGQTLSHVEKKKPRFAIPCRTPCGDYSHVMQRECKVGKYIAV